MRTRSPSARRASVRPRAVTAADLPPAIQWHEGMLLAPQHFQESSRRHELLLNYHTALASPFHWGVRRLEVDPAALVDGTFRVLELEAVMPDHSAVSARPDDAAELTLDLAPFAERLQQGPLPVHVAIAARRRGASTVEGEMARYRSVESEPVVDENSGGAELRIPRLVPRLHLLAADDPPPKFVTLPIAEVAYAGETFALTPWVPPGLEVARHSPLGRICSEIATRLREKAVFLAERVHSPSAAARRAWLLETQAAIHGVVAGLPHLEALVASGAAHPFPLYLALCQIVGQVAGVGSALVPPVLEPYEHDDLLATFEQARRAIFQVLDEGILETYAAYPFRAEGGAFRIDLDPAWKGRRLVIGVRTRDGVDEREVRSWIDAALIGSASRIPSLRERRIVGAPRRPIDDDRDLVAGRNRHLFDLEADPDFVAFDEPLELRNLDDPAGALRPLEVLLYVRKDDADGA